MHVQKPLCLLRFSPCSYFFFLNTFCHCSWLPLLSCKIGAIIGAHGNFLYLLCTWLIAFGIFRCHFLLLLTSNLAEFLPCTKRWCFIYCSNGVYALTSFSLRVRFQFDDYSAIFDLLILDVIYWVEKVSVLYLVLVLPLMWFIKF